MSLGYNYKLQLIYLAATGRLPARERGRGAEGNDIGDSITDHTPHGYFVPRRSIEYVCQIVPTPRGHRQITTHSRGLRFLEREYELRPLP